MSGWLQIARIHSRDPEAPLEAEAAGAFLLVRATVSPGTTLVLRSNGRLLATEPVGERRGTDASTVGLPALVLEPDFEVQVSARLDDDSVVPLGRIAGTVDFAGLTRPATRSPLLVTGAGRSGTTMLMRMFREHPQLAVVDEYPFESRHGLAMVQQLVATSAPALHATAPGPGHLVGPTALRATGANPFFSPSHAHFEHLATDHFALRCQQTVDLVDRFYDEVDRVSRKQTSAFVEKFAPTELRLACTHLWSGTRVVIMVRDPRDVAISQDSFNHKRGFEGFGLDGLKIVERTIAVARSQIHSIHEADRTPGAVVVRYEDLVSGSPAALQHLLRQLGLDVDDHLVDLMAEAPRRDKQLRARHMTARSEARSVGRWRRSLSAGDCGVLEREASELFAELGYGAS